MTRAERAAITRANRPRALPLEMQETYDIAALRPQKLALALGTSISTINRLAYGGTAPPATVDAIAKAFAEYQSCTHGVNR